MLFLSLCLAFLSCSSGEERKVRNTVSELVNAMNKKDMAKAQSLFNKNRINPKLMTGDSSSIYRMLTIASGENFKLEDIEVDLEGSDTKAANAKVTAEITGEVKNGDKIVGEMHQKIGLLLEKNNNDEWKIITGSETLE